MKLDERKRKILAMIVEEYLNTSRPVGSNSIASIFGDRISSATVRSEMAFLYELGLLEQPHTSAGRVPSINGYRLYAESIANNVELEECERQKFSCLLGEVFGSANVVERAALILAKSTSCVAIVSMPRLKTDKIERIELVPTLTNLCVVAIFTTSNQTRNRTCNLGCVVPKEFFEGLNVFLSNSFVNKGLEQITQEFVKSLVSTTSDERFALSSLLLPILICVYDMCAELSRFKFFKKGINNLLEYEDLNKDMGSLVEFLEEDANILELMRVDSGDITIRAGPNIMNHKFDNFSFLVASYYVKGLGEGGLALIGPIRLDYGLCVRYLKHFVEVLPEFLN